MNFLRRRRRPRKPIVRHFSDGCYRQRVTAACARRRPDGVIQDCDRPAGENKPPVSLRRLRKGDERTAGKMPIGMI
ncbi:hypothetical protein RHEC894_PE00295 (plasmid) [Rhizobium sp. CIAT894]|nr:hypothetical protein RHEC894_PE00295 [Rhizobium sp. CIAT894]